MPFTVVQLTDLHVGAPWSQNSATALATAVAAVRRTLLAAPDAAIVSGDIANTPVDVEYAEARALLDGLDAPLHVVAGNHDDREGLRRHFDIPQTDAGGLNYAADLGPVRLVVLDTKRSGSGAGELEAAQLEWLDRVLTDGRTTPTLLAMHHPPLVTGMGAMDAIGIPQHERLELAGIVRRHRQVQLIVSGHVHRTIVGELGGTTVLAVPGTNLQLALDFDADDIRLVREPPCFAIHVVIDGRIISHIQPVDSVAM